MWAIGLAAVLMLTLAQSIPPLSAIPDLSTHKEVKIEVEISASAGTVWRALTNFPAYDIWNPYIYPASGEAVAGRRLDLTLRGGTVVHFSPTVLVARPDHELSWGGTMPFSGIERVASFEIHELGPHSVRLIAIERFRGILLPLAGVAGGDLATGLNVMTRALRERAELLDYLLPAPATRIIPHT